MGEPVRRDLVASVDHAPDQVRVPLGDPAEEEEGGPRLAPPQEVEDALAGIKYFREELEARSIQLRAARSASTLSRARYDGGITDYLEVLDSDRSLFDAQLAQSAVERLELVSIVNLYKALGGGWPGPQVDESTVAEATPAAAK